MRYRGFEHDEAESSLRPFTIVHPREPRGVPVGLALAMLIGLTIVVALGFLHSHAGQDLSAWLGLL